MNFLLNVACQLIRVVYESYSIHNDLLFSQRGVGIDGVENFVKLQTRRKLLLEYFSSGSSFMIYFDEVLLNYSCNNILKINIFSGSILGKMSRLNKGTVYRLNVVVKNIRRLRSIQTPILISYNHQISIDSIPYYYISSPQFLCEASPVEVHLQANTLAVQCRECMRDQQHNAD